MTKATRILVSFNVDSSVSMEFVPEAHYSVDLMEYKFERGICRKFLVEYLDDEKHHTVPYKKYYLCSQEEYYALEKKLDVYYVITDLLWGGGESELW